MGQAVDLFHSPRQHRGFSVYVTRNIFKKIYNEVTEDIFDMSNVRFCMKLRKNGGCLNGVMPSELSKAFSQRNLSYSKISVVMLLGYRIAGISQKLELER